MKKFLITVLTSGKLNFLKESYNSIINQEPADIDYDIVIIVNTLNDSYYEEVNKLFKNVIRTESNGYPGKGHNSCINYFKEKTNYDYLIPLDGDDFIYPFFLKNLLTYIKCPYNPDILFLPFSDNLTTNFEKCLHYPFKQCYFNFNLDFLDCMNSVYKTKLSPFKHSFENINTPGRIILISRNALYMNFNYQEDCKWYDDLLPFLQIFETSILYPNKYNIYFLEDYYLHIYNSLNDNSASKNFLSNVKENIKKITNNALLQIKGLTKTLLLLLSFIIGIITWPFTIILATSLAIEYGLWTGLLAFILSGGNIIVGLKNFFFYGGAILLGSLLWPILLPLLVYINT